MISLVSKIAQLITNWGLIDVTNKAIRVKRKVAMNQGKSKSIWGCTEVCDIVNKKIVPLQDYCGLERIFHSGNSSK